MEERGSAVRAGGEALIAALGQRAAIALCAVAVLVTVAPTAADGCGPPAGFTPRARVEQAGVVLLYRTEPATIEVGRHFAVDAVVCADAGTAVLSRVDAQMPEHRHGMNYRPTLAARGTGRYLAEGLMFHMPGRWQFVFDVERAGERTRLTSDVDLE